MEELLIVNPSRRPSKRRKNPSPAQKRARAAFAAMARARSKNPAKRRASTKRRTHAKRRHNPIAVSRVTRRTSRRRNPISLRGSLNKPMAMIGPALTGAIGAIAVNTVLSKIPLPAIAMTGKARYLTQGAAAILLGVLAQKVGMKGATAVRMAEGALTVTLHDAMKEIAAGMGMNLGNMGYYLPGLGARGAVPPRGAAAAPNLGQYISGPGAGSRRVGNISSISARPTMAGMGTNYGRRGGMTF